MIPSEKLTDVTEAGIRRLIDHGVPEGRTVDCEEAAVIGKENRKSDMENTSNVADGRNEIAERFEAIVTGSQVSFAAPADVAPNWLPAGYELVTDPDHVLRAADVGNDIRYVAKLAASAGN
ncbi:hypothetical protein ACV229_26535 [Burkholderia sp. MR1-5-21]